MTRRRCLCAALLSTAVVMSTAVPAATAAGAGQPRTIASAATDGRLAHAISARSKVGTVEGKIRTAHRLKSVDIVLYARATAEDASKGWVPTDYQFATGYGLTLNNKTGAYSFKARPGTYRLEFNGTYSSGHAWGIVTYGPDKPSAAAFGKSVTVRKAKAIKHINVTATGDFGAITEPDPGPTMSPTDPTPGGSESVALGTWPKGTTFTYTWQVGNSQKYLSFKKAIHVPSSAAGKSLNVTIYAHAHGKNGAAVSITTTVAH